jgi:hypothetical protein
VATQFDLILRDAQSAITLYDQNVQNPVPAQIMLTNVAGLKTVRASYDFTTGVFYPKLPNKPNPIPGQVINNPSGWFLVAKVMNLSRGAYSFNPPIRCLLLHCDFLLAVYRGGALVSTRLIAMTREDSEFHTEADTPLERLTLIVPIGSDVQMNDQIIYDIWVFRVSDKLPENLDGHQYAYRLLMERFGTVGQPGDPSGGTITPPIDYLLTNAYMTVQRRDTFGTMQPVGDGSPVPIRYVPDKNYLFTTQGDSEGSVIYTMPGVDIQNDDVVTIVSESGHTDTDDISTFVVNVAARIPAPLPVIKLTITGFEQ